MQLSPILLQQVRHLRLAQSQFLLGEEALQAVVGIVMGLVVVYQVQVVLKAVVEILAHLELEFLTQEILMIHLHHLDGDVEVQIAKQQTKLVVAVVALVMEVVQVLKVVMVFNCHLHSEIQMDTDMITSQIIHLDPVELLVGM